MTQANNARVRQCLLQFYQVLVTTVVLAASVLTPYTQGHVLEFVVEPSDTIVESGQSAVLDCVVKAAHHQESVYIQWLDQDRHQIIFASDTYRSQLTNGSIYINSVIEEQRLTGNYQCMATLPNVGSIISRIARLDVARLSGFHEEPRDISVYVGQKAYFACHINAAPPPKIRWLKDERPIQIDELRMTVLPSGALEIDEVIESDQGSYRCNASGLNSYKLSNKATLIVIEDHDQAAHVAPPTFIAQPRPPTTIVEGQNMSLDCAANGNPNPTITWLKDGYAIDMNFLDSRFSLVGSTSSLRITNIKEEDTGTYQCRAENREDSLDASAVVTVQVPPKFLTKPQDKTEMANKDVELECSVYGIPEPKIQWFKDGDIITFNDYYQLVTGHNLKIMGLMLGDSGLFQCFATNAAGNIQAAASLKVLNPETKRAKQGQQNKGRKKAFATTTSSSSSTSGNSKNSKKDDTTPRTTKLTIDKHQSIALFSNLKSDSSAKLGEIDFGHLATLRGLHNRHGFMQDQHSGSSDTNPYDPHSAFTSLKSSESTSSSANSDGSSSINLGDVQSAFFPSSKRLPPPFSADSTLGYQRPGQQGQQQHEGLPGAPQDLKAPIVKARFVILSWKAPQLHGDSVQTYTVYYRQEGSERERVQNTSRSRLEEISIGGLTPNRVYHFRVVGINSAGMGQSSESLTVTTQSEEHVASAPVNFVAYATSPRSIHVSYRPPETPNGVILRYTVYYMETSSSIEHNIDTTDLKFDLVGLSIYTEYSIWVVAVNENGPGAATEEKVVRTLSAPPSEPPYNVTLEPSSTSIIVRWEPPPPEYQNGVITGYKLRYRKQGKKGLMITTAANERWYILKDLDRGSVYQVKLMAINVNGTGPSTEWYEVETYQNDLDESRVPDEPGPLRVRPTFDKLYVLWTPPTNQNIRVRNYILGWGKGIPDMFTQELDEKTRSYIIERLEPNSEYVLSLRASNEMGAGPPVYTTVRTQDEPPPEPQPPLIPPVGLKAQVLSSTSVVLYWTDTTLSKSQYVRDNRHYVVKYTAVTAEKNLKNRFLNVSDLNVMIDDLKPNTLYEFTVKLVKGRKESPWSMVVQNTTWESPPNAAPRDLDVHLKEDEPHLVELTWAPPKITTGRITGYVIMYTDNKTKHDREWLVQAIKGDKHSSVLTDLKPNTEYFFKVQARNSRGYGPYSNVVVFTTGQNVGKLAATSGQSVDGQGLFSDSIMLYILIGGCAVAVTTIALVTAILCCRRRDTGSTGTSPDRNKKGYQKGATTPSCKQPPDLWIHHDQMELKNLEKSQSSNTDGASSSGGGAMTLPRSVGGDRNEYDAHDNSHLHHGHHSGSLDKRTYVPNYVGVSPPDEHYHSLHRKRSTLKTKPIISLPVDSKPPREPIATPINTASLSQSSSDSTPSSRPSYPRTQYNNNMPRAHVTVDSCMSQSGENPYALHAHPAGWIESHPAHISQPPPAAHIPPGGAYAPGMSVLAESQAGLGSTNAKRLQPLTSTVQGQQQQQQQHPLKSFTVPAPPPISAPGTPQAKHIVTVRPSSSPFKKPPISAVAANTAAGATATTGAVANTSSSTSNNTLNSTNNTTPPSRINPANPPPHTAEEVQRLQPSHSTEELNQEMANLEGLMLTLNAITANEFEC